MAVEPEDDREPHDLPLPLDYMPPGPTPPALIVDGAMMVAFLVACTVIALGAVWVIFNLSFNPPGTFRGPLNWEIPGGVTAIAVLGWTSVLYCHRRSRGILLGALIGLGIGLLIEGACFAANR